MIEIRQADPSDLDALQSLVCGFREVLGRRLPDDDTLRESLEELLMSRDTEFFIALGDTSMAVGYIQQRYRYSLWLSGLEATLEDLYVSSDSRRLGVGTQLVQFAIESAREKGCKVIKVDTNESNRSAMDLYFKLGFTSGSSRYSNSRQLLLERSL